MRNLLSVLLVACVAAHPRYFVERILENADGESCILRPDEGYKGHGDPIASSNVAFTLTSRPEQAGSEQQPQAVTEVCPGRAYNLEVELPGPVEWLMTTTVGRFQDAMDPCPNRLFTNVRTNEIRTTLTVPCQELPESIDIQVTFSDGRDGAFQYANLRLPISSTCKCQSPDEEDVEPLPAPPAPVTKDMPEQEDSKCPLSQLGYQCRQTFGGVTLHFTWRSDSPTPPPNVCTGSQTRAPADSTSKDPQSGMMAHWAVESASPGFVSVAFAEQPGKMVPAEAVLGGVDDASGQAYISTYRLTSYVLPDPHGPESNWATQTGAVQLSNGTTIICFSTELPPAATVRRQLLQSNSPPALKSSGTLDMNWAVHSSSDVLGQAHNAAGSFVLDPESGNVNVLVSDVRKWVLAHSILMALAFVFFLPTGILLVRHRSLYPTAKLGPKAVWFWAHSSFQLLGTACFVAAIAISLSRFGSNYPAGSEDLGSSHRVIGIILIPLLGIQVLAAIFLRPKPSSKPGAPLPKSRAVWNVLHHNWGRLTAALALANVYIGIVLYHRKWSQGENELAAWLASITGFLAVLLVADAVLSWTQVLMRRKASIQPDAEVQLARASKEGQDGGVGTGDHPKADFPGNGSMEDGPAREPVRE